MEELFAVNIDPKRNPRSCTANKESTTERTADKNNRRNKGTYKESEDK